eukprot:1158746-Pelagomonas_calceolata.AAC.10
MPEQATYEFASNADLKWPALEPYRSACTVDVGDSCSPVSGAASLPFQAPRMTMESGAKPTASRSGNGLASVDTWRAAAWQWAHSVCTSVCTLTMQSATGHRQRQREAH